MEKKRIFVLDALKGIAAVTIVLFHTLIAFPSFHDANYYNIFGNSIIRFFTLSPTKLLWSGQQAVLLFFILSGFFLGLKYRAFNEAPYKVYAIQRIVRLYLPYIIIMVISGILASLLNDFNDVERLSRIFEGRWSNDLSLKALIGYFTFLDIQWQLWQSTMVSN